MRTSENSILLGTPVNSSDLAQLEDAWGFAHRYPDPLSDNGAR